MPVSLEGVCVRRLCGPSGSFQKAGPSPPRWWKEVGSSSPARSGATSSASPAPGAFPGGWPLGVPGRTSTSPRRPRRPVPRSDEGFRSPSRRRSLSLSVVRKAATPGRGAISCFGVRLVAGGAGRAGAACLCACSGRLYVAPRSDGPRRGEQSEDQGGTAEPEPGRSPPRRLRRFRKWLLLGGSWRLRACRSVG